MQSRKERSGRLISAKVGGQRPIDHRVLGPGGSDADCFFFYFLLPMEVKHSNR